MLTNYLNQSNSRRKILFLLPAHMASAFFFLSSSVSAFSSALGASSTGDSTRARLLQQKM
jgi:hypothetical protein